MCGLAGWATTGHAPDVSAIASMVEALPHRNSGDVSALIDTQPRRAVVLAAELSDTASGISLAFDGALLNAAELRADLAKRGHSFEGDGDAEVLLRAYQHWDKEMVKRLRGPFAFVLWDAGKERLLLARDHFGQKPLYLHEAGGALAFASEVRALVRAPMVKSAVDVGAVGEYLAVGYVRSPRTLVAGVRKLAPGSYALWQFGNLRSVKYWQPPDGHETAGVQENGETVDAFIMGHYDGNMTASGNVEIAATGRVSGNIKTDSLVISKGGYFNGNVSKIHEESAESSRPVYLIEEKRAGENVSR